MMVKSILLESFWSMASSKLFGIRRMSDWLQHIYPSSPYQDTLFYFPNSVPGYIALTIDDGLCRPIQAEKDNDNDDTSTTTTTSTSTDASKKSMVKEICDLLQSYQAHATFFVCTEYTQDPSEVALLLQHGHEFGNHLQSDDTTGYYTKLNKQEFTKELQRANQHIQHITQQSKSILLPSSASPQEQKHDQEKVRWFRAPQGRMTTVMRQVLEEQEMIHVLGDVYGDDCYFAEHHPEMGDAIVKIMLAQAAIYKEDGGSIAVFHMPQRGFREATFTMIQDFLKGLQQQNIKCITLSEMMELTNKQKQKQKQKPMKENNESSFSSFS